MSANDYLAKLRAKNPKLFAAQEIKITPTSLEAQIAAAFDAGKLDGYNQGKNSKSVFDQIFG